MNVFNEKLNTYLKGHRTDLEAILSTKAKRKPKEASEPIDSATTCSVDTLASSSTGLGKSKRVDLDYSTSKIVRKIEDHIREREKKSKARSKAFKDSSSLYNIPNDS